MKLAIAALALAFLACGKKSEKSEGTSSSGPAGGCDRRETEKLCGEYHGAAKADWVKKECEAMKAPYVAACPKDGAVGRCVNEAGSAMEVHTLWYAPATKETVAAMCKSPMQLRDP